MDFHFSRFEIVTGTGALFLGLVFVCLFNEASAIETEIGTRALSAVAEEKLFWVSVEGDGQALVLGGAAVDDDARARAGEAAAAVPGVTSVDNRITVIGAAGACQYRVDEFLEDRQVTFKAGREELSPTAFAVLSSLAGLMRSCGAAFEVAAHTGGEGDSMINRKLSQRRAEVVVRQLVQSGVPADWLTPVGYGETQPMADNRTEAGRAANSRVEFRVLSAAS